jgi:hypothetical protein
MEELELIWLVRDGRDEVTIEAWGKGLKRLR